MTSDLDARFLDAAKADDPDPIYLAALIWECLGIIEQRLDEVHWFTVDDNQLPRHLANKRRRRRGHEATS